MKELPAEIFTGVKKEKEEIDIVFKSLRKIKKAG